MLYKEKRLCEAMAKKILTQFKRKKGTLVLRSIRMRSQKLMSNDEHSSIVNRDPQSQLVWLSLICSQQQFAYNSPNTGLLAFSDTIGHELCFCLPQCAR